MQDGPSISQLKSAAAGVIRRVSSKARPSTCAPRLEKHGMTKLPPINTSCGRRRFSSDALLTLAPQPRPHLERIELAAVRW